MVASYVHNSVADGLGKIGVIVALEFAGKGDELKAFGRMVAMHVASSNPQAVDVSGLDAGDDRAGAQRACGEIQGAGQARRRHRQDRRIRV